MERYQDSGQEVVCFKYVALAGHLQLVFTCRNGSNYFTSYFSYISQDNTWESYNHLNFMIFYN